MKPLPLHRYHFQAMGSPCSLHLYTATLAQADAVAAAMQQEVQRLEHKYSRYRDDSITAAIRAAALQSRSITVDAETASLLDYAHTLWEQSEGRFDITSGVLREVWRFPQGPVPPPEAVNAVLPRVGWQHVRRDGELLWFDRPGMELDFGGFVKEYAADAAAAIAIQQGVAHGLVELGGDIRVIGPHPDGRPWAIGIRHPRLPGQVWATLALAEGALASSGDYERCIVQDGQRYGHVLDPRTGWPVQGLVAVSAVADHCLLAGSLTTLGLLLADEALAWLDTLATPWLAMDAAGHIYGRLPPA